MFSHSCLLMKGFSQILFNPRGQISLTCAFRAAELDFKTKINDSQENWGQRFSPSYVSDSIGSVCFKKRVWKYFYLQSPVTQENSVLTESPIHHLARELIFTVAFWNYFWQQANRNLSLDYNNCSLVDYDGLWKRTPELELASLWLTVSFKLLQSYHISQDDHAHREYLTVFKFILPFITTDSFSSRSTWKIHSFWAFHAVLFAMLSSFATVGEFAMMKS